MSNDEQQLKVGDTKETSSASLRENRRPQDEGRSLLTYVISAIIVAVLVRYFIAAPYLVSGPSMEETFHNHDYLIVDHFSYGPNLPFYPDVRLPVGNPQRGDVIVFKIPVGTGETLIKRVIGLPGETVIVRPDNTVMIKNAQHPDGFVLNEPYITPADQGGPANESITLGPDQYFVMGDNRKVSYDSRSWGPLPRNNIIGRVFLRLYPFSDFGVLPGEARY